MKIPWNFIVALIVGAVTLNLIPRSNPFQESETAWLSLQHHLAQDSTLSERLTEQCSSLRPADRSEDEKRFLQILSFGGRASTDASSPCFVQLKDSRTSQLGLVSHWHFAFRIWSGIPGTSPLVASRSYPVYFPRPLCFLPFLILMLALLFDFRFWGLKETVVLYLFLLSGANVIHAAGLVVSSALLSITTDRLFPGLMLATLALALQPESSQIKGKRARKAMVQRGYAAALVRLRSTLLNVTIGIWSPLFHTALGPWLFPLRRPFDRSLRRLSPFFESQFIVTCLSLYLLSVDVASPRAVISSLLLPRYFTFTVVVFLLLPALRPRHKLRQLPIWKAPHAFRYLGATLAIEVICVFTPLLRPTSHLLRVGAAMFFVELANLKHRHPRWKERALLPCAAVALGSLLASLSLKSGVVDLILAGLSPASHPTAIALFTFLTGIALGFLCGTLSTPFFILLGTLITSIHVPLVRAALLDGILAGSLLSPFSLYNLLPAAHYSLPVRKLFEWRLGEFALPLLLSGILYSMGAFTSLDVLRPVTFLFLCLCIGAVKLRQAGWRIGTFSQAPHSGSR